MTQRLHVPRRLLGLMIATAMLAPSAHAQDGTVAPYWIVTVGAYGLFTPNFEGARRYGLDWRPIVNWRRSDEKEWLDLPGDGFGFDLFSTDDFRMGPVADWRLQRHVGDTCLGCRDFGNVDVSFEAGGFAEYWPREWLRTRVEIRHAVVGGAGLVGDLSSDVVWRPSADLLVAAGPRLSLADQEFMTVYYGAVAAAGTPELDRAGGLRSAGLGGYVRKLWGDGWASHAFVEWEHLTTGAANPAHLSAVGSRDNVTVGLGLSYDLKLGR